MAPTDAYVTAKANLRDNVKTLIAVFGGVAGVLVAGTPFSGYGALPPFTDRWYIASGCLVGAVMFLSLGLRVLLKVLQPDISFPSALRANYDPNGRPFWEKKEIAALRRAFADQHAELLPDRIENIEELEQAADQAWMNYANAVAAELAAAPGSTVAAATRLPSETLRKNFDELNEVLGKVNQWSGYTRLHYRVRLGTDIVLILGLVALGFIGTFATAVSGKGDKPTSGNVVVIGDLKPITTSSTPLPPIEPVRFVTNMWILSPEAIKTIGTARDYLRSNPNIGVLVFAYTDTQGGPKVNRRLAAKRAESVTRALMVEGGISSSRVFVTVLPETDLPVLTAQEKDNDENRAVQLLLIPIPPRK